MASSVSPTFDVMVSLGLAMTSSAVTAEENTFAASFYPAHDGER
jgi:hypothetical protein